MFTRRVRWARSFATCSQRRRLRRPCRQRTATTDGLEVETDLAGSGARRHIVRAAKGREEIVERILVRHVDDRQAQRSTCSGRRGRCCRRPQPCRTDCAARCAADCDRRPRCPAPESVSSVEPYCDRRAQSVGLIGVSAWRARCRRRAPPGIAGPASGRKRPRWCRSRCGPFAQLPPAQGTGPATRPLS